MSANAFRLKSHRRRWVVPVVAAVVVLTTGSAGFALWRMREPKPPAQLSASKSPTQTQAQQLRASKRAIRIIASGDELPHLALSQAAKTATGYDYAPFYRTIKPYFQTADIRFCNQETVTAGEQYGVSGYPSFNVSKQFARDINSTGCNLINLANNHMNDKGQTGINETLQVWEGIKPLAYAGVNRSSEEQQKVRYFTQDGVKFAFVAYTALSNTHDFAPFALNMLDQSLVTTQLTEARKQADVVLVSVHWGTEYSDGIDNQQAQWATTFASLGADVVIGTGPHVLEPVKKLPKAGGGETTVWYSLGNMLSAQLDVPSLIGGFAVMDVDIATKRVQMAGFLPTYMHYEWTADQKAREDLLARHDFQIYPLDQAAAPLARSQNNTTVQAQTERVNQLLNTYTKVPILTSQQFLAR